MSPLAGLSREGAPEAPSRQNAMARPWLPSTHARCFQRRLHGGPLRPVEAEPARPTAVADLATATTIVPVSANPAAVTLRTAYCFAAVAAAHRLPGDARGGPAVIDFETAY